MKPTISTLPENIHLLKDVSLKRIQSTSHPILDLQKLHSPEIVVKSLSEMRDVEYTLAKI